MRPTSLAVIAADQHWARELHRSRRVIADRLNRLLGTAVVKRIKISSGAVRVETVDGGCGAVARRERAAEGAAVASVDDDQGKFLDGPLSTGACRKPGEGGRCCGS